VRVSCPLRAIPELIHSRELRCRFSSGLLQMAQGRMQCLRTLNDDSESEKTDLLAGGKKDRARRFRIVGPVGITI
jgi:hypothetical protein